MDVAFGVYVHVPFCRDRCDYCAFSTYSDRDHLMSRYVDAVIDEVRDAYRSGGYRRASSVYFGGGTPSRLGADELVRIADAIPVVKGAEVTVECNPEDATIEKLSAYKEAGVTRMSFGVQSTLNHVLESLGRRSASLAIGDRRGAGSIPEMLAGVVDEVGFESWNLDLIYGAVDESDEDWRKVVTEIVSMSSRPPHLSLYALTVEPGTVLASDPRRRPDDDVQAARYEYANSLLESYGYRWEEISNWALPGHGCRHNQLYWSQGNYLGIGSAAHSHVEGRRWSNIRDPERYIRALNAGLSPSVAQETLSDSEREFEKLALSIRTPFGVPVSALAVTSSDLVERKGDRAVLSVRGRLVANDLTTRLITAQRS